MVLHLIQLDFLFANISCFPTISVTESYSISMDQSPVVFDDIGVMIPQCLLPSELKSQHLLENWVTIACDQYPHDIEYWEQLYETRKDVASTLHLVFPNVFMVEPKAVLTPVEMLIHDEYESRRMEIQRKEMFDARMEALKTVMVDRINRRMIEYTEGGVLTKRPPRIQYIERTLYNGTTRKGLLMCIDLEKYDYSKGSKSLIRPTKRTVPKRVKTRLEIRKKATLEVPHVLIFVDDRENELIEPLREKLEGQECLYDFSFVLNKKANFIRSYSLGKAEEERVIQTLQKFASPEEQKKKYGIDTSVTAPVLFAVGDGNHSLATAKEHWEYIKKKFKQLRIRPPVNHPARFSLVEVISLYDKSIEDFEPVHRIVKNVEFEYLMEELKRKYEDECVIQVVKVTEELDFDRERELYLKDYPDSHFFPFYAGDKKGYILLKKPKGLLEVSSLMDFLDSVVDEDQLEYIFEKDTSIDMTAQRDDRVAFLLPKVEKKNLFGQVIKYGVVPRKAYSVGVSQDKRVYMECRFIQKKEENE